MEMIHTNSQKIAHGYCRVSTKMQTKDGISLATQKERILAHCAYKNLELVEFYEDAGISGKSMDRPALQKLLNDMTKSSYVIVFDLYRLGRNTRDALDMLELFMEKGVYFVCLNPDLDYSTPIGELMFTIISALGRMERRNISANVSINMQRISREGKLRNRPPFGYKFVGKDKDFEPIPEQIEVLNKILTWYDQRINTSKISKYLNQNGDNLCLSLNKKDMKDNVQIFYPETIKNILKHYRPINGETPVVPIENRIISHHKPNDMTISNNVS
jgi:site-specific DNA recombinase